MNKNNQNSRYSSGYTLLFAVLVSSLTLAIGVSILNISKKEFLLSSGARESSISLYTADSGLECAIYQDGNGGFSTSSPITSFNCNGKSIDLVMSGSDNQPYTFTFNANFDGNTCATVIITKSYVNDGTSFIPQTKIESRGYNLGWNPTNSSCDKKS